MVENLLRITIPNWDSPINPESVRQTIRTEYLAILLAAANNMNAPHTPTYNRATQQQRLSIGSPIRGIAAARSSPLLGPSVRPSTGQSPGQSPSQSRVRQSSVTSEQSFRGFSSPGSSNLSVPPINLGSPLSIPRSNPTSAPRSGGLFAMRSIPPTSARTASGSSNLRVSTAPATAGPSRSGPGSSGLTPVTEKLVLSSSSDDDDEDQEDTSGPSTGGLISSSPSKTGKSKDKSKKKKKKTKSKGKDKYSGVSKKDRKDRDRDRDGGRRHGVHA
jgi:hypothetical protein